MNVRRSKASDLAQLTELYKHLHPEDVAPAKGALEKAWEKINNNSDIFIYFVVEADNQLVCSCNLTVIPNLTRGGRPLGLIENVVTHTDFRKKGLARQIIEAALAHAKQEKCYKVMLMSGSQRTDSHQFYKAIGFSSEDKVGFVKKLP